MKGFIVAGLVVSSFLFGCAGAQAVRSGALSAARGSIVTRGQTAKAIVVGPTVIHAYSADTGGGLYTAPAVTGLDGDCAGAPPDDIRRPIRIRADQRVVLNVEPGQIACLSTSSARSFELLWHAQDEGHPDHAEVQLAIATGVR